MAYTLADAKKHVQQAGTLFHNRMVEAYSKATSGLDRLEGVDSKKGEEIGRNLYKVLRDAFLVEATGSKVAKPAEGSENMPDFIVSTLLGITEDKFTEIGKKGRIIDYLALILQLLEQYKNGPVRSAELQVLPEDEKKALAGEIGKYAGGKLKKEVVKNPEALLKAWMGYDAAQAARGTDEESKFKGGLEKLLEKEN